MGMVYACRHRELQGQMVAAKVLFNEVASDKIAAARFKNEILASYGVSHPNVVRAYEFVRDGELIAYTMEFVGGGDLADRMSRPDLVALGECLRLLGQMAAGVQAIHDAGIVHRDLKPENILLTNEGQVKIADFGIARKTNGPKLTEHGGVVGTLEYVAPEYMLRSQVDWRSDIYALGVLAYELITGEPPFKGDSAYASISKRLQTDPEPPSKYRSECSKELDGVILRALARDPEQRYQSAMEMFYDIQRVALAGGMQEASGVGVLIPPQGALGGKRYVGPTLSDGSDPATGRESETNVLTSDGSIEYRGEEPARISKVSSGSAALDSTSGAARSRSDTELLDKSRLGATEMDYEQSYPSARRDSDARSIAVPNDPLAPSADSRREARSLSGRYSPKEFPVDILERSNQRLRMFDVVIFLFAALTGCGFGYVFLRIFAPSFLEQIGLFGFGS
jgi:serine/threonine protein kinase